MTKVWAIDLTDDTHVFLVYCPSCHRKHKMTMQPCPECNGRGGHIPMPASDKVMDSCYYLGYKCAGCEAFKEHWW